MYPADVSGAHAALARAFQHRQDLIPREMITAYAISKGGGPAEYGTTLDNPDLAKMEETIGMRGISVEDPSEVPEAIQAIFAHEGAVLIDRGQSAGAFDAAQDPTRSGQGIHPLHAQGGTKRQGGRNPRPRNDQSLAIIMTPLHR
jgi:hypothetical protein